MKRPKRGGANLSNYSRSTCTDYTTRRDASVFSSKGKNTYLALKTGLGTPTCRVLGNQPTCLQAGLNADETSEKLRGHETIVAFSPNHSRNVNEGRDPSLEGDGVLHQRCPAATIKRNV